VTDRVIEVIQRRIGSRLEGLNLEQCRYLTEEGIMRLYSLLLPTSTRLLCHISISVISNEASCVLPVEISIQIGFQRVRI